MLRYILYVILTSVFFSLLTIISPVHAGVTLLHEFSAGGDGSLPFNTTLVNSGSVLYGTTSNGGSGGNIFSINADGTNYNILHVMDGNDGSMTNGGLILSGSTLYGVNRTGGTSGLGTIFKMNTDGSGFAVLHSFAGGVNDGSQPFAKLAISGSVLYGTTNLGGDSNKGTIFSINTDGTSFTLLHEFAGGSSDGSRPNGGVVINSGVLYGATYFGGVDDYGTIFSVNTNGSSFSLLHSFDSNDGEAPYGGPIIVSGVLYGTAILGGDNSSGVIYKINTNGTNFANIHHFHGDEDLAIRPYGSLLYSDSALYGMTQAGGDYGGGVLYSINIDGTNMQVLHHFAKNANDGGSPYGGLIKYGNYFYGETNNGGDGDFGTVFSYILPDATAPTISLTALTPDPTNDSTPTLSGTATDAAGTVSSVQFQMDGTSGSWSACLADDGTFDESSEPFTCTASTLTPGSHTMYVRTTDNSSNVSSNSSDTFEIDTSIASIQNISFTTSNMGASITYTSSEAISTQMEWGSSTLYGITTTETDTSTRVTSHSISLSGLLACRVYHFRILGSDGAGNTATSSDQQFETSGCTSGTASSLFPQIPQLSTGDNGGGVYTPTDGSNTGSQSVTTIIEPKTFSFDAFVYAHTTSLDSSIGALLENPITGTKPKKGTKTNAVRAGSKLGVRSGGGVIWQVGNIQQIWYKSYAPKESDKEPAKIIPELQKKPSIVALSYVTGDLIPPGKPKSVFNTKTLKLANSIDGITWKILPTSVVDTKNKTVAALHKVGGYYMIVGR